MFELLVVSSNDKRFIEWIKCFEILFDVPADQIMTDYYELVSLVKVTTTTYNSDYVYDYENEFAWIDDHYNWITLLPNRNQF